MSWSCLSVDTTSISTRYIVHIAIISYQGDHTAANLAGVVNVRRHPCRVNWLTATVGTMTRDCHHLRLVLQVVQLFDVCTAILQSVLRTSGRVEIHLLSQP